MNKYWESEPNAEIDTGKNILRYYKDAGRIQISTPKWTDKDGNEKNGKTLALNLDALRKTPGAVELLQNILA